MESSAGDMWKVDSSLCSVPQKIFQLWVRQNGNWETLAGSLGEGTSASVVIALPPVGAPSMLC